MPITSQEIKEYSYQLGFAKVGIVRAEPLELEGGLLREWLAQGYHGKMNYMQRGVDRRTDPRLLLPSARSVISVAFNYYTPQQHTHDSEIGKISRYAWGDDYHDVLGERLLQLLDFIQEHEPYLEAKCYVDAGPMMDKAWAVRAGIGWLGKHTNVITREYGSWVFLGEILLSLELEYDDTIVPDYCGTCTRCIEACPTQAIIAPYLVDSQRCISYATIELKDEQIPAPIKDHLDNWIFGCDVCQDVCPWNRFARECEEERLQPREGNLAPRLDELLEISATEFKQRYQNSPITRPKYAGFLRNVQAVRDSVQTASQSLRDQEDEV
ncbi:MAG: tRNA epoxyqueuosine(34) reductase QueG [Acidobacteriota bacterium]